MKSANLVNQAKAKAKAAAGAAFKQTQKTAIAEGAAVLAAVKAKESWLHDAAVLAAETTAAANAAAKAHGRQSRAVTAYWDGRPDGEADWPAFIQFGLSALNAACQTAKEKVKSKADKKALDNAFGYAAKALVNKVRESTGGRLVAKLEKGQRYKLAGIGESEDLPMPAKAGNKGGLPAMTQSPSFDSLLKQAVEAGRQAGLTDTQIRARLAELCPPASKASKASKASA